MEGNMTSVRSLAFLWILYFIRLSNGDHGNISIAHPSIVGGNDAPKDVWAWQVSIQFEAESGDVSHVCGGVLIDPSWVVTAAHCVDANSNNGDSRREDPYNYQLVLGAHNLASPSGEEQIITPDLFIKHEEYENNVMLGFPNDIALVRLQQAVDTTPSGVGVINLPSPDMDFTGNFHCWITGWGKTSSGADHLSDVLQEANTYVIDNAYCEELTIGSVLSTHLCAGEGRPNACSGDSGGPLSCWYEDGSWYAAGLASWTIAWCDYVPVVFTRMAAYYEWVKVNMEANPRSP